MNALTDHHPVAELCAALGVSRSGYYAWLARPPSAAGAGRCGTHLSALPGPRRPPPHRWPPAPGERAAPAEGDQPSAPNRLAAVPPPRHREQIWVTDRTSVPTDEGWLSVAGVLDRWSRRVSGLALASHRRPELVSAALRQARTRRQPAQGCRPHSERGCQYARQEYRQLLAAHGLELSRSRSGNGSDNAARESFWSTLKSERVPRRSFATRAEARTASFEYGEVFYNRQRRHSALGYHSPVDFENQNN